VSNEGLLYVGLIDMGAIGVGEASGGSFSPTTITAGVHPCTIQFSTSGMTAYVSNQDSPSIGIVDVASNRMKSAVPMPVSTLILRMSTDGSRLFITGADGNLYVLGTASDSVVATVAVAHTALMGVTVDSATSGVYVAQRYAGNVTAIDAGTLTIRTTYTGGTSAQNVVVLPDAKRLVATDIDGAALLVWDIGSGKLVQTITAPNGSEPFDIQLTPDKAQVYVTFAAAGVVDILDASTLHVVGSISTGGSPRYVVFDKTGKYAAITNDGGWVDFIH
jgi:YVTN family beta-propeller protein